MDKSKVNNYLIEFLNLHVNSHEYSEMSLEDKLNRFILLGLKQLHIYSSIMLHRVSDNHLRLDFFSLENIKFIQLIEIKKFYDERKIGGESCGLISAKFHLKTPKSFIVLNPNLKFYFHNYLVEVILINSNKFSHGIVIY